jgi:shikimate dehydrogenase
MPLKSENRKLMSKIGTVIYLRTEPESVFERLRGNTTRPLLMTDDPEARIRDLMNTRRSYYEAGADFIIDTDGKTPAEIAREIEDAVGIRKV